MCVERNKEGALLNGLVAWLAAASKPIAAACVFLNGKGPLFFFTAGH